MCVYRVQRNMKLFLEGSYVFTKEVENSEEEVNR